MISPVVLIIKIFSQIYPNNEYVEITPYIHYSILGSDHYITLSFYPFSALYSRELYYNWSTNYGIFLKSSSNSNIEILGNHTIIPASKYLKKNAICWTYPKTDIGIKKAKYIYKTRISRKSE